VHAQVSWLELGDDLTSGPCSLAGGGAGRIPFWVCPEMGRGPNLERGQTIPPRPFLLFLFFSFSFSDLPFLLYSLQKCFKTIQTIFRNFLKKSAHCFKPVIKQVFKTKHDF
jgi:hypothetical protein